MNCTDTFWLPNNLCHGGWKVFSCVVRFFLPHTGFFIQFRTPSNYLKIHLVCGNSSPTCWAKHCFPFLSYRICFKIIEATCEYVASLNSKLYFSFLTSTCLQLQLLDTTGEDSWVLWLPPGQAPVTLWLQLLVDAFTTEAQTVAFLDICIPRLVTHCGTRNG